MDASTVLNFLKLPKKIIFTICVLSGILLFSSDQFLVKLAVLEFKKKYTLWFGIIFLATLAISITNISDSLIELYKAHNKSREQKKARDLQKQKIAKRVTFLDDHELNVIREFFIQKKHTIEMGVDDPTVVSLARDGVIAQVGQQGYSTAFTGRIFYFELNEIALNHASQFDFNRIKNHPRPKWITSLQAKEKFDQNTAALIKGML
jgi:hypothetical protein